MTHVNDGGPVNTGGFVNILWIIFLILAIVWLVIDIFQKLT